MPRTLPRWCSVVCVLALGCRGPVPEILEFRATPPEVDPGQPSTLRWVTRGASRIELRAGADGAPEELTQLEGQRTVTPTATTTYVLTAFGEGTRSSASLIVSVGGGPRILNFSASPAVIAPGTTATLAWATENAVRVSIRSGAGELLPDPEAVSGQLEVIPAATTGYRLTATGADGRTVTADVTVEVVAPPEILSFTTTPAQVDPLQPVTLSWRVAGASEVTLKKASTGASLPLGATAQQAEGSFVVKPDRSETYTLVASGAAGTVSASVDVAVQPVIAQLEADPPGADPSEGFTLRWKTYSAHRLRLIRNAQTVVLDSIDPDRPESGSIAEPAPGAVAKVGYELEITSREGVPISRFLEVAVAPKPQFQAFAVTPEVLTEGKPLTVSWKTSGAASLVVKLDGAVATILTSAARVADGSWESPPLEGSGTHRIEVIARSAALSQEIRSAEVTVVPAPSVTSFSGMPGTVSAPGSPVQLAWSAANATRAELRAGAGWVATAALPSGTAEIRPLTSGTWALRAKNLAGDFDEERLEIAVQNPSPVLTIAPEPFVPGEEVTVSWDLSGWGTTGPRLFPPPYAVHSDAFTDISSTGAALPFPSDDDAVTILAFPLGFSVSRGGVEVTESALVSTNGFLSLGPSAVPPLPQNLAAADPATPPHLVAPFWDDLLLPAAEVRWQLLDSDRLAVQWTGARLKTGSSASGQVTFQVILHREGGVDFRYGPRTAPTGEPGRADGASATIGITGPASTWSSELSYERASLTGVSGVRFLAGIVPISGSASLRPGTTTELALIARDGQGSALVGQARLAALAPGAIELAEALPAPGAGADPVLGEWLELRSRTGVDLDLTGAVLATSTQSFTLPAGTRLPAGGRLVVGASTDGSINGGAPVTVAWGNALQLADAADEVTLTLRGSPLASLGWGSSGRPTPAPGSSVRRDEVATLAPGAPAALALCLDATPTPGSTNGGCAYDLAPASAGFLDVSSLGQDLTPSTTSGDWRVTVDLAAFPGAPPTVPLFGVSHGKLEISANGWLSLFNGSSSGNASSFPTPRPLPSTQAPNAVLAPFWDDLSTSKSSATSPPARLYVHAFDPDGDPATANRVLCVQWSHFDLPNTSQDADLNFQVLLHEDGPIELRWGALAAGEAGPRAAGASANIGLEDAQGLRAITLPAPLTAHSGVQFLPVP